MDTVGSISWKRERYGFIAEIANLKRRIAEQNGQMLSLRVKNRALQARWSKHLALQESLKRDKEHRIVRLGGDPSLLGQASADPGLHSEDILRGRRIPNRRVSRNS